jgi:glycosyltransferase involved in cell wall biosynthesis
MKPLTTVLVDTYNHERYIEQALVSVVEQRLSPTEMEVVVVDDGSTDNTPAIVQKFTPRVKYIRKKNGGQASAFNAAFPECSGQIVAFLDGDDWFAKGKVAAVVDALEQNPEVSAVGHGYYKVDEDIRVVQVCTPPESTILHLATPDAAREAIRGWQFLLLGALTVRKRVLERIMPIPQVLVFSADNPIQMASMAMGALLLKQPLCYYRHHADNLYAISPENRTKLRRKCEMLDLTFSLLYPMLLSLGVPSDSVSALLDDTFFSNKRFSLSTFGGGRLKTFQTEMRCFQYEFKNPSVRYRLFKYFVVGAATLLLSPQRFYKLRDWCAREDLRRYRELLFKRDVRTPNGPSHRIGPL